MAGNTFPEQEINDGKKDLKLIPDAQNLAESLFSGESDLTLSGDELRKKFPGVIESLLTKGLAYEDIKAEVVIGTDTDESAPSRQIADVVLKISSPQYPEDKVVIVVVRANVIGVSSDSKGTIDGELVKGAHNDSGDLDDPSHGANILLLLDHGEEPSHLNPTYRTMIYKIAHGLNPSELVNITVQEARTRGGKPLDPQVVVEFIERITEVSRLTNKRTIAGMGNVAKVASDL